jgi:hypothetical protein
MIVEESNLQSQLSALYSKGDWSSRNQEPLTSSHGAMIGNYLAKAPSIV